MEKVEHKIIPINGLKMHVAELGEGPLVLFLHGFPELWYSWRHQMVFMAARGYRAVAPDRRGYGDTTGAPLDDPSKFTLFHLVGDLISLLDVIAPNEDKEPGDIEAEFEQIGTKEVMKNMLSYRDPSPFFFPKGKGFGYSLDRAPWLTEKELDYYVSKFEQTGFTGAVNYYRAFGLNWELNAPWSGAGVKVPAKFIIGDLDMAYHVPGTKEFLENGEFKRFVPLLEEVVVVEGAAHYLNQERPREVNQAIYDFIKKF